MKIDKHVQALAKEFTCGYCFAQSGYNTVFAQHSALRGVSGDLYSGTAIAVLECRNCSMLNLLVFGVDEDQNGTSMDESDVGPFLAEHPEIIGSHFFEDEGSLFTMWIEMKGQYPNGHKLSEDVPWIIRKDLLEAANCLAVGASNAATIMCRRVIERLATHLGARSDKGRMLGAILREFEEKKLIDEKLLNAFREVKDWGNISTHPSKNEEGIGLTEAKQVVEFTFLIVESIFPQKDIASSINELRLIRENR
jgi:hypothetical protein